MEMIGYAVACAAAAHAIAAQIGTWKRRLDVVLFSSSRPMLFVPFVHTLSAESATSHS